MPQLQLPQRRSPRLKDYDYSQPGSYFITICIQDRAKIFGDVVNDVMYLGPAGENAQMIWNKLPERFPMLQLDDYVIMPNHFHGIVVITEADDPATNQQPCTLGEVVRAFKALTSYYVHASGITEFRWQRKYWDTIIRDERRLLVIRQYIANNPARWSQDKLYR